MVFSILMQIMSVNSFFMVLKFLIVWSSFMSIVSVNRNNEGKRRIMVLISMSQYNIDIISGRDPENIYVPGFLLVCEHKNF